jgi:MoCo/4Fe-4S cofactor protein with predicted Tat translocation signal
MNKTFWKSLAERDGAAEHAAAAEVEFPETPLLAPGVTLTRRGFMAGFAAVFAGLAAGCARGAVHKAIPFLIQPEEVVPGRATWYATTCGGCPAGCGALVKCRDGRPIKLEGLPGHPVSAGGLCAAGQAQVLSLYDPARLRGPRLSGKAARWGEVDAALEAALGAIPPGGAVRVLTGSGLGPTERAGLERFLARFPGAKHIAYDALSAAAILDAHARTHGRRVLPRYRFDRARAIVSFDADFLGTWISPVEFTAGYRAGRTLAGDPPRLSWHCQLEARLSLTGGNADRRIRLAPAEVGAAVAHLAAALAKKAGIDAPTGPLPPAPLSPAAIAEMVERLLAARGEALVVCGANDVDVQTLVNLANHLVGAYGATVDIDRPARQLEGDDRALRALVSEMQAEKVAALFIYGANPVYDLPEGAAFAAAMAKIPLTVAFATHDDETARAARIVAAVPHFLERWGDLEPIAGVLSMTQPAIAPLGDTRSFSETLARLSGDTRGDLERLRETAEARHFPRQKRHADVQAFFDAAVGAGFALLDRAEPEAPARLDLAKVAPAPKRPAPAAGLTLVAYPKVALRDGRDALNPWLQELPDPVTKVVWDNYASLSERTAAALGVETGSVLRIAGKPARAAGEVAIELPALVQPGQHDGVVAVALGYGRAGTERFASVGPRWVEGRPTTEPGSPVGVNVAPLLPVEAGLTSYAGLAVTVTPTGRKADLAVTQDHHSLMVPKNLAPPGHERRPHVQVAALAAYAKDPRAGGGEEHAPAANLWPDDFKSAGPRWAMAVDLNACTGCGACVVGCQAENNVPVVGKDEVRRHREMHWIRIDRYYAGEGDGTEVVQQPVMCQHCANAPCETVCPVLATVHSREGLNQQVYNRCLGTRYCANNCPYKVRRFNWFDYAHDDLLQNLVLNPDVVVRSRGVMEKCSLCVQRIQEAKAEAQRAGVPLAQVPIRTACEQSCPAQAIVFGDAANPESEVSKRMRDPRCYFVLGELGVRPSVGYMTRIRNTEAAAEEGGAHHG